MSIVSGPAISAAFGAAIILFCTLVEQFAVIERYPLLSRVSGIAMNMAQFVLTPLFAWPMQWAFGAIGVAPAITIPLWTWLSPYGVAGCALEAIIILAVSDFLIYCRHRAEHKWFWPIHAVHHAPTELHAANDIGHPAQVWPHLFFVSLPLSLVQYDHPVTPAMVGFIVMLLSYLIHSPIDVHFGPLRKLLVDNRFHRIHHSIEPRHFDRNFGICFSVWDRLFGTAYDPAPDEWPKVGISDVPAPRDLSDYLLMPVQILKARSRNRIEPESEMVEGRAACLSCTSSSQQS